MRILSYPHHAYLSVKLEKVQKAGVSDKISQCSYMTATRAYLEEDRDLRIFVEAAGIDIDTIPVSTSDVRAPMKSYQPWDPYWAKNPVKIGAQACVQLDNNFYEIEIVSSDRQHFLGKIQSNKVANKIVEIPKRTAFRYLWKPDRIDKEPA